MLIDKPSGKKYNKSQMEKTTTIRVYKDIQLEISTRAQARGQNIPGYLRSLLGLPQLPGSEGTADDPNYLPPYPQQEEYDNFQLWRDACEKYKIDNAEVLKRYDDETGELRPEYQ